MQKHTNTRWARVFYKPVCDHSVCAQCLAEVLSGVGVKKGSASSLTPEFCLINGNFAEEDSVEAGIHERGYQL